MNHVGMNERIPILEKDGFIICFEAIREDMSSRQHFVNECGWTQQEFEKVRNFYFFSARVTAWKDGKELGAAYLGACSYRRLSDFYTKYKNDYCMDLANEAIDEAKKAEARALRA